MVDGVSITALIMAIITGLFVFINKIHKCKCNKGGIEVEREMDIEHQQEFTINLINSLRKVEQNSKNLSPKESSGENDILSENEKEIQNIISKLEKKLEKESAKTKNSSKSNSDQMTSSAGKSQKEIKSRKFSFRNSQLEIFQKEEKEKEEIPIEKEKEKTFEISERKTSERSFNNDSPRFTSFISRKK
jgi:membrane carboxypeptidase/penicillin-binding protein